MGTSDGAGPSGGRVSYKSGPFVWLTSAVCSDAGHPSAAGHSVTCDVMPSALCGIASHGIAFITLRSGHHSCWPVAETSTINVRGCRLILPSVLQTCWPTTEPGRHYAGQLCTLRRLQVPNEPEGALLHVEVKETLPTISFLLWTALTATPTLPC